MIYGYGWRKNIWYTYRTSWLAFTFITIILDLILILILACTQSSMGALLSLFFLFLPFGLMKFQLGYTYAFISILELFS